MKNRFRVEIYDANKAHDMTLFLNEKVDREYLTELVVSNIKNFEGTVRAFTYDNVKKKKITALFYDESIVNFMKDSAAKATKLELDLI
jgi:hypothetical protein